MATTAPHPKRKKCSKANSPRRGEEPKGGGSRSVQPPTLCRNSRSAPPLQFSLRLAWRAAEPERARGVLSSRVMGARGGGRRSLPYRGGRAWRWIGAPCCCRCRRLPALHLRSSLLARTGRGGDGAGKRMLLAGPRFPSAPPPPSPAPLTRIGALGGRDTLVGRVPVPSLAKALWRGSGSAMDSCSLPSWAAARAPFLGRGRPPGRAPRKMALPHREEAGRPPLQPPSIIGGGGLEVRTRRRMFPATAPFRTREMQSAPEHLQSACLLSAPFSQGGGGVGWGSSSHTDRTLEGRGGDLAYWLSAVTGKESQRQGPEAEAQTSATASSRTKSSSSAPTPGEMLPTRHY